MNILILGPGCPKCRDAEKAVKAVLQEAGVEASVEKVTDFQESARCGGGVTPAGVSDGEIKGVGKVPAKKDILDWIDG